MSRCDQRQLKMIYRGSVALAHIWIFFLFYNTWDCTRTLQRTNTFTKIRTTLYRHYKAKNTFIKIKATPYME